ncbi:hypothetical protein [Devosia sp. 1635]|uniref:hypothetical protein n=1 Tax=Devosia sp. 1635 TaxID=2726066 RepID=UPI00156662A8|nr:hypothetical protein [Devosia sp. 1635]
MRHEVKVTPAHVKAEAARRIEERYPLWKQLNILREGGDESMVAFIDGIRDRSNRLEAKVPIPPDYQSDHHWN